MMRFDNHALAVLLSGALLLAGSVAHADEVRLTDGGRVRGRVIEESPKTGVRVVLANGTVKSVPAAEVAGVIYDDPQHAPPPTPSPTEPTTEPTTEPPPEASVAPPRRAAQQPRVKEVAEPAADERFEIQVTSVHAGALFARRLDGPPRARHSRQVAELRAGSPSSIRLPEGRYSLTARFQGGDAERREVFVGPDADRTVAFERSWRKERLDAGARAGMVGGASAGYTCLSRCGHSGGAFVRVFADVPGGPWGGVRTGVDLASYHLDRVDSAHHAIQAAAFAELMFFAGRYYRPAIGVAAGGLMVVVDDAESAGVADGAATVGPQASALRFTFGEDRAFEIDLSQRMFGSIYSGGESNPNFVNTLTFGGLF